MPAERGRRGLDRRFSSRARHDLAGARRRQWEAPWLARTARHLRSPRVLRSQRLEPRSARRCCRVRQPTLNRTTNGGKCRGQPETSKGAGKKRVRATSHPPRAKPSLRPLAPSATPRASCTRTRSPPRAIGKRARHAGDSGADDRDIDCSLPPGVDRICRLVEPEWRAMLRESAVDPVSFGRQAPDVELCERSDHLGDCKPGLPDQLVGGGGQELEDRVVDDRPASTATRARATRAHRPPPSAALRPRRRARSLPADSADVISPGTANTSRPSSSAKSAVISAPLRSRASTTIVAAQRPAMIRLRAGKRHGAGSTPGSYSETISERSAIDRARSTCAAG